MHPDYTDEIGKILCPYLQRGQIKVLESADRKTFARLYDFYLRLGFPKPPLFMSRETFALGMASREGIYKFMSVSIELCYIHSIEHVSLWNGTGKKLEITNFAKLDRKSAKILSEIGVDPKIITEGHAFLKLDITQIYRELHPYLE